MCNVLHDSKHENRRGEVRQNESDFLYKKDIQLKKFGARIILLFLHETSDNKK